MNHPFSVQVYSFNKSFGDGFPSILKRIAELGFDSVEMCGGYTEQDTLVKALNENGLALESWHFGIDEFIADYSKAADYHKAQGNKDIVIPWYDLDSMEKIEALAEKINQLIPKFNKDGFCLSYHNHAHEFAKIDGKYILEILGDMCPDMYFEPDVYWIAVGGEDPVKFINEHADRIRLVHLKNGHGSDRFDSLDCGIVDIKEVVKAAKNNGITRFIVENDNPQPDAETNLKKSLEFLENLTF